MIAALLAVLPCAAQVFESLDLTATREPVAFYVVFAARGESSTGHAFVVWGMEDSRRRTSTIEALGFYPEQDPANCDVVIRTVAGRVMDELANHSVQSISHALVVRVDRADFERTKLTAHAWDCKHEFSLLSRDCVEFLRAVGDTLHLRMPSRGVTGLAPQSYVQSMIESARDGSLAINYRGMTAGW